MEWRPVNCAKQLFVTVDGNQISNPHKELDLMCRSFRCKSLHVSPTCNRQLVASWVDSCNDPEAIRSCASMMDHSEATHTAKYNFSGTVSKAISNYRLVKATRRKAVDGGSTDNIEQSSDGSDTDSESDTPPPTGGHYAGSDAPHCLESDDSCDYFEDLSEFDPYFKPRQPWSELETEKVCTLFHLTEREDTPKKVEIVAAMKKHKFSERNLSWKQVQDKCRNILIKNKRNEL